MLVETITSISAYSVDGLSFVPKGKVIKVEFTQHQVANNLSAGIVSSSSAFLSADELVELIQKLNNVAGELGVEIGE